jgi:hypothetical protein
MVTNKGGIHFHCPNCEKAETKLTSLSFQAALLPGVLL